MQIQIQVFFCGYDVLEWDMQGHAGYSQKKSSEIIKEFNAVRGDFIVAEDGVWGVIDEFGDGELALMCLKWEENGDNYRRVLLEECVWQNDDLFSVVTPSEGLGHSHTFEYEMRNSYSGDTERTGKFRLL